MLFGLVMLAALFGLLFGFDEGVIAGAMELIKVSFDVDPVDEGLMAAAVPLGAVAGAIVAANWSDRVGRRITLILCSVVFLAGALASSLSVSIEMLTLSRLLLGLGIGASALTAPQFLAELAPARIRGAVVSAFQLMITVGIFTSYLSNLVLVPLGDWRVILGLGMVPAIIALLGILKAPESPRWLVLKGRSEQARTVLRRIEPDRPEQEIDTIVSGIEQATRIDEQPHSGGLFSPGFRNIAIFALAVFVLQQFSGINAVIYYAPTIMGAVGFDGSETRLLATVGIGVVNVLMTIVAMLVVDRFGRRPLLIIGFFGSGCSLVLIAATIHLQGDAAAFATMVGLVCYIGFFAVSLGPLPWLYMSELFPIGLRSRGMAFASVANWSTNFAVVFLFPVALSAFGITATFAIFAGCCGIGFLYALRYAPETKGQSLEEIEQDLSTAAAPA
jgi:MFS transporter, SP family, galactose:H+ symporter